VKRLSFLGAALVLVACKIDARNDYLGDKEPQRFDLGRAASAAEVARSLGRHAPRARLRAEPPVRAPRTWSLALARRMASAATLDTLFVTANLNAGGAQRSLVNLVTAIATHERASVAVTGDSTSDAFLRELAAADVDVVRTAATRDPFDHAEALLRVACATRAGIVVFWNVDAKVKLLVTKFAAALPSLRLVDVSPGAYAFEELATAAPFAEAVSYGVDDFYRRLDVLVLKFAAATHPPCTRVEVIEKRKQFVRCGVICQLSADRHRGFAIQARWDHPTNTTINNKIHLFPPFFIDHIRVCIFFHQLSGERCTQNGMCQFFDNGTGNFIIRYTQTNGIFFTF